MSADHDYEPIEINAFFRSHTHLPLWEILEQAGFWKQVGIKVNFEFCDSSSEAEAALLRAVVLHRQLDQYTALLKGYCEQHGEVTKNGVAATHKPVTKRRFNLVDVLDVLAEHGITDLTTLPKIELAGTSLKPLLETKKRAAIAMDLLQKARVTHGERFAISKPVDPDEKPVEIEAEEVPA